MSTSRTGGSSPRPTRKASSRTPRRPASAPKASGNGHRSGTDGKEWNLRLYIAGDSPRSQTALRNLRRLCDERLAGKFSIEVVDLTKRPDLAKTDQIIAVPTLVRKLPEPMKRIIGDLSDADRALLLLELDV